MADKLPGIPQARMVVNEPGEDVDEFLKRADQAGIGWPRLFRPSAVAELMGYEGAFTTVALEAFEVGHERVEWNPNNFSLYRNEQFFANGLRETIGGIRNAPQELKRGGLGLELPDQINVIIAERAKCLFVGTYIKQPNQEQTYLIGVTRDSSRDLYGGFQDAERCCYRYTQEKGIQVLRDFSIDVFDGDDLRTQLEHVVSWHDKIASLPDMDSAWTYQVEFSIDPPYLFQVRPFMPLRRANFKVTPPKSVFYIDKPIVIGVTSTEGLVLKVVDHDSESTDEPCVFVDELRVSWKAENFPNLRANLFDNSNGFLQHQDVIAMKRAQITALFRHNPHIGELKSGDYVRIISDGESLEVTKVS